MTVTIRQARREDIPAMHRIRLGVRENRLVSAVVTEARYVPAIEVSGRGWVAEVDGVVAGFAVGNSASGNIWALFVDPAQEGRGIGRRLHDVMLAWLWSQALDRLWLTTAPGTRAERFYEAAGWSRVGAVERGEQRFEKTRPTSCA